MEFTLLWQAGLGIVATVIVARTQNRRVVVEPGVDLGDRLVGAAVAGLVAGRITAMILQGVNPILRPADILVVRGGVHTGAATMAALASLAWGLRHNLWRNLDAAAPAALAGLAGWHAGCVFRDACLGAASSLPWALAQSGSTISRHPVEIYAAGLYALAATASLLMGRGWRPGVLAGFAIAVAGGIRLVTQPLRPSIGGGPVGWYLAGVVAGIGISAWNRVRTAQAR